MSARHKR